jgi:protoporphyrinogen oxidase
MPPSQQTQPHVAVIGAGFTGLAAALDLCRSGLRVTVLEADSDVGGLAGSFEAGGEPLEKFYHHWFTSDEHILGLIRELGLEDRVLFRPTRTGMYMANRFFRLSSPLDVLRFTPLTLPQRIRLGVLALRARSVADYEALESITAREWLIQLGGPEVYRVVWEPLLRGKFGEAADDIAAIWIANKLRLRGGSRGKRGEERLAYFRGGFSALAGAIRSEIERLGGTLLTRTEVTGLQVDGRRVTGVMTKRSSVAADAVLATPALPITAQLVRPHINAKEVDDLLRIRYLGNVCVVLELDRSLSSTYWLNVNDPGFPFVAVIEHTNFEPASTYSGRHIVYLSRYLPGDDPMLGMSDPEILEHTLPHVRRMFPAFSHDWILASHVWRAEYAQPIVERNYRALIPPERGPLDRLYVSTMAQIYPEDRGTNYAVRAGRRIAAVIDVDLRHG